jgi:hypothetical protein
MERQPVTSSNLAAVGYDPDTETLEVEFKNGSVYTYSAVPADVYNELMEADSIGRAFAALIKAGGYAWVKE